LQFCSLAATIEATKPGVLSHDVLVTRRGGLPIPNEMPPNFLDKEIVHIEDIGEPTTACFFTLSNIDPTNW